ncbi:unnamed protein product [Pleuronectes platessa]|uniref:Uncharacterized protein n=1 Tax=Pleuronectes platessa TaxID=8262 RepID=A0A9N7YL97_PLEPL|nr:unnamed protein product [Pleuronectes platessa]
MTVVTPLKNGTRNPVNTKRGGEVGYCASESPIQGSGLDELDQRLLLNTHLHSKRTVQEIGLGPGVNKDRDCVSLSFVEELVVEKGPRGHSRTSNVAHQRPWNLCTCCSANDNRVLPSCIGSAGSLGHDANRSLEVVRVDGYGDYSSPLSLISVPEVHQPSAAPSWPGAPTIYLPSFSQAAPSRRKAEYCKGKLEVWHTAPELLNADARSGWMYGKLLPTG